MIVPSSGILIDHFTTRLDLEDVRFNTTNNLIIFTTNIKLNFNQKIFLVDRIEQLRFIDTTKRFTKQPETESVEQSGFTTTILTNNQSAGRTVEFNFSESITC